MLSFNGARITRCSTGEIVYNRTLPAGDHPAGVGVCQRQSPAWTSSPTAIRKIYSGICPNRYVEIESGINGMPIVSVEDFPSSLARSR